MSRKSKRVPDERALIGGYAHPRDPVIAALFGIGSITDSGVIVNENTVFNSSAVFAAVNLLSSTLGTMCCEVITETRQKDGTVTKEHDYYSREAKVLSHAPNSLMTAFTFFSTAEQHALMWGNAYAEIETTKGGDLINLWPITPDICQPVIRSGTTDLWYEVRLTTPDNQTRYIPADKMLHVPGLGYDGIKGYSVLNKAKDSIGLTLAGEKVANKTFRNSAVPAGILSTDGTLKDPQITRMRKSWEDQHQGLDNTARIAILEAGLKYQPIQMSNSDAELLSTRKFQIAEVARWFNVPPHMLKDLEKATFSNITMQSEEFIIYSVLPWIIRFEQEINRKIFMPSWTSTIKRYVKFDFDVFLRPQLLERFKAYNIAIISGFMNRDEPRLREGWNIIPDGKGKDYLIPLNMTTQPDQKGDVAIEEKPAG